ncbi:MAG: hypothetical protein LBD60_03520 [Puniceicoccales bacterium]|jgi:hypothetical protein|nr:hypothetical protein [Puniceicoccales bacterium]
MKSRLRLLWTFLWIISCSSKKCYSAGGGGFGFECFEHKNVVVGPAPLNAALNNYTGVQVQNAALPVMLAGGPIIAGVNDIVSFCISAGGVPPVLWGVNACSFSTPVAFPGVPLPLPPPLPGALTYRQKAQMVLDRERIGIPVKFRFDAIIRAYAAGGMPAALAAVAAGAPGPPGGAAGIIQYLNRAFGGGGYSSPMAIMLYRLRFVPMVFPFLELPGGGMPPLVVLHIHIPCRVSKNMKELQCNSFYDPVAANQAGLAPFVPPPPAVPPPAGSYVSIKCNIDNIWIGLGFPPPSSATVLSYDAVPKK